MRASILLGVIAALLLGYILIFERGSLSTRELDQRAGSVLPELVRAKVSRIEIQRNNLTTVLARDLDSTEEAGLWHVEAPYKAEADPDAIDTLLGDLEWLHGARTLGGMKAEDRKRFGLHAPRARLWFTVGSTRVPIRLGSETPQGDGVYVETNAKDKVFVVGKDFAESLAQPAEHFHTKVLHEGVLVSTAKRLSVRDADGERVAKARSDGMWSVEGAGGLFASTTAIGNFIDALDALRASRFITTSTKELARYGLEPAQREITLIKRQISMGTDSAAKKSLPDVLALRLRIGAACEGHTGEHYVTAGEGGSTFCALDADLDKLKLPLAELEEKHLLPIQPDGITALTIARDGTSLVLTRSDETWTYEQKRGDKTLAKGTAREGSAQDFLEALHSAEAADVSARSQLSQTANATTLTVARGTTKPALTIKVALDGMNAIVQRGDEPHPLGFAAETLELVEPSTARFRAPALLSLAESSLTQLEITRGSEVERIERATPGAPLNVTAPLKADADRIAASDVARLLTGLTALRFAADEVKPEHGLSAPVARVHAQLAKHGDQAARSLDLRIGALTEGGRYATLEGERGVFVISAQLADLLTAPLLSRTLLATPLENIVAIEVRQGARKVRVQRNGETFELADASPATNAVAGQCAQAVATLRAQTVVSYGPAPRTQSASFAELEVEQRDGTRTKLVLGAEAENGLRHARRADLDADFLLPASAVSALLAPLAPQP